MKSRKTIRAVAGIVLIAAGFWLAFPKTYRERTYLIPAGGCRLETGIIEKKDATPQGTVLLFPGLVANKKVMTFVAEGFAEQNLQVFVPDLPGHGHSPGPFSPEHAEECAEALLSGLIARGMANPDRTILVGHSMGGAIAERIATRVPVAGLIAISPAPMRAGHGVSAEELLFRDPPDLPPHSLVMVGALEPQSIRWSAAGLAVTRSDGTTMYEVISGATHGSILFSAAAVRSAQRWAAQVLNLGSAAKSLSLRRLYGALAGFAGLLLLATPFLREIAGKRHIGEPGEGGAEERAEPGNAVAWPRMLTEFAVGAFLVVVLLRFWDPLRPIHLYEGDYLAGFLFILGDALVLLQWKLVREQLSRWKSGLLGAFFGALILFLLFSAWLELSLYEAWLTPAKWARFPFLFLALLPYHLAEEICLGPSTNKSAARRYAAGLSLRAVAWGALAFGLFYLHSGEILMVLLLPYFVLLHLLLRRGMDIARHETGSAAATAVFGAILLAGFCLVIFPVT